MDFHFFMSNAAWMTNKHQIAKRMGNGGCFGYLNGGDPFREENSIKKFAYLQIFDAQNLTRIPASNHVEELRALRIMHQLLITSEPSEFRRKTPKELSSISEQTNIPVYMDGLARPPRKCRV